MNEKLLKMFNSISVMSFNEFDQSELIFNLLNNLDEFEFNELIGNLLNKWRSFPYNSWNIIKLNWRKYLKFVSGRVCPICGKVYKCHFNKHLYTHKLSELDYILLYYNLNELPKCKNPNCSNKVGYRYYVLNDYCSKSCELSSPTQIFRSNNPNVYVSSDVPNFEIINNIKYKRLVTNIKRNIIDPGFNRLGTDDYHDKLIIERNEQTKYTNLKKYGTTTPSFGYYLRTEWNCDPINHPNYYISDIDILNHNTIIHDRDSKSGKLGGFNYAKSPRHNWKYWYPELTGLPEKVCELHNEELFKRQSNLGKEAWKRMCEQMSGYRLKGWHSYPEELLSNILFKLSIHYIREYILLNHKYRADYYLPDYNIILECDGMFKWSYDPDNNSLILGEYWINRKQEIESKTGIKIINIPSNDVFYYNKNKRNLINLIRRTDYPLIKIS